MSEVKKRSVVVDGHKTSISLEEPFWTAIKNIASERGRSISELVREIEVARGMNNLSSAIRVFVLAHYVERSQLHGQPDVPCKNETRDEHR